MKTKIVLGNSVKTSVMAMCGSVWSSALRTVITSVDGSVHDSVDASVRRNQINWEKVNIDLRPQY